MTSVPPSLQAQLGETISIIADSDFWTRWDTLVDVHIPWALIHKFQADLYRTWFLDWRLAMPKSTLAF